MSAATATYGAIRTPTPISPRYPLASSRKVRGSAPCVRLSSILQGIRYGAPLVTAPGLWIRVGEHLALPRSPSRNSGPRAANLRAGNAGLDTPRGDPPARAAS